MTKTFLLGALVGLLIVIGLDQKKQKVMKVDALNQQSKNTSTYYTYEGTPDGTALRFSLGSTKEGYYQLKYIDGYTPPHVLMCADGTTPTLKQRTKRYTLHCGELQIMQVGDLQSDTTNQKGN